MLASTALALFLAALILFLKLRRHRKRSSLPVGELLFGDNIAAESCPVLVSHRYGLKGRLDALVRTPEGALILIADLPARVISTSQTSAYECCSALSNIWRSYERR
jgi:hypothetical protein